MVAEREHVVLEPFFAAGVLIAALSSASFTQTYYASAAAQVTVLTLLAMSYRQTRPGQAVPARFMIAAAAIALGAFCTFNGRIISQTSCGNCGFLSETIRNIGIGLRSAIDEIPFKNPDTNALLKALLSGYRNDLPKHVTEAFRASGASHILALSGLHLGIIYTLISKALCIIGNKPKTKAVQGALNIAFCTIYTLATGASASMTRALLFITLREIGKLTGRPARLDDLLQKSLLIQLAVNPLDILDIGFQLSYAAMAGIVWIHPHLCGIWMDEEGTDTLMKKIWNSASLSISCQLTTLPLTWYHFKTFPPYFLLTNLLALPLTGIMMPLAAVTVLLSHLGACPSFMTTATEWLIGSLVFILEIISGM